MLLRMLTKGMKRLLKMYSPNSTNLFVFHLSKKYILSTFKINLRMQSKVTAFSFEQPRIQDPLNASHPSLHFGEQSFVQYEYLSASQPKIGV